MPKFRVSLFSLALMLAVPFAPQAVAKTAAATTASQPEIASGSAMIVDLNTNKVIYSNHPDLVRPIASISKLMTAMVVLVHKLYYGHFMCYVFHQDYIVKKGVDVHALKEQMLELLQQRGAQYPAEHNVGHLYKAPETLQKFYRENDPTNSMNPGIGKTSKRKNWQEVE